jgi:predicted transcriptional regulator
MKKLSPIVKTIMAETERRQWSVVYLGQKSGVPFQTIYRIFQGASPNIQTVEKLLDALDMKLGAIA